MNKKITPNFSITKDSINEVYLKYYRISLPVIGISMLVSGLVFKLLSKDMFDPLYLRIIVALPFLLLYGSSYVSKYFKKNLRFLFNCCLSVILLWSLYIAGKNDFSFITTIIYILVASINTAALGKAKYIPFYSIFTIVVSIAFFFISGIGPSLGYTIVLTILLAHFVTYLVIKSKEDTEKSLIESESRVTYLVEALGEGIGVIDNDDMFVFTNPSANEIFEVEPNEIIGQPFSNFLTNITAQVFANRKMVTGENHSNNFEITITSHQKKCKTLLITETSYNLPQQGIYGSILVFRDISERIRAEKELKRAKNKAEESDKLKSAFLANMSHEIRTPMNSILGFADLLKRPELSGNQQQEYIAIIQKSGKRMLNIINDIIDISKIEAGLIDIKIGDTNINKQIEQIYTSFKPEVESKGLNLTFRNGLTENKSIIRTDTEKLYAILVNLVKNAIKYSHKGSIEIGYVLEGKETHPDFIKFYVNDTGIGIPANRQDAIFERFVQADIEDRQAYQGSGLGLSITKAYVELLGGRIWVESQEGVGSTFFFTIPYKTDDFEHNILTGNNEYSVKSEKSVGISGLKILIAEDDLYSEMLISSIFNETNNEIIKVVSGIEAVEICKTRPDIDLILMDIRMPKLNGYEATKAIRAFNKDVVIIAQTAFGLSGDREKAIEAGCNDYISKPIKSTELIELVNKYVKKKTIAS